MRFNSDSDLAVMSIGATVGSSPTRFTYCILVKGYHTPVLREGPKFESWVCDNGGMSWENNVQVPVTE